MLPLRALVLSTAWALSGCGASSAYDQAWVSSEVARGTGHAVPARPAPEGAESKRYTPTLPPDVVDVGALAEDEAVSIALWNSAQFRADLAQLGFSRADLADAAALPNPNLSFLLPMSTRQLELSVQYPVSTLVQRPWRIASAKLEVERTARALVHSGLDYARDVRIAWAELDASVRRLRLRLRAERIVRQSAELASLRLRSGDVSALEADLVKAESLAAAELANRGAHEQEVARARLCMLLGLAGSPLGSRLGVRVDERDIEASPSSSVEELDKVALGARPDLRAAEIAVEAAAERLGLERSRIVQLFARLDAKPVCSRGGAPLLWLPGFTADIPIFNQNAGGRARAHAELERVSWMYLLARQQVVTDVHIAHEELAMALTSREPWKKTIVPLQEKNVAAALRAYEAGAEPYLVVLDATRRLVEANLRELELGLDERRARARLDRAVGWRMHASH